SGGAPLSTVMLSEAEPTDNSKSISTASCTCSVTSGLTSFLKPVFSTSIRYVPGTRLGRKYSPVAFVVVSSWIFVAELMAATLAPAILALEASVTPPEREAFVDWAQSTPVNATWQATTRNDRSTFSPPNCGRKVCSTRRALSIRLWYALRG